MREKVALESAPAASESHGSKGRIEQRRGCGREEERSQKSKPLTIQKVENNNHKQPKKKGIFVFPI